MYKYIYIIFSVIILALVITSIVITKTKNAHIDKLEVEKRELILRVLEAESSIKLQNAAIEKMKIDTNIRESELQAQLDVLRNNYKKLKKEQAPVRSCDDFAISTGRVFLSVFGE